MVTQKKYNWGILGVGNIAGKFASDLKLLTHANLHAVGSRSKERAEVFAGEFEIPKAYGSYEELVSDPDIDVIYIASRHVGHYPDTLLALNHGKAVLCEKPIAMNQKQFEVMVSLAEEKQLFFMGALWTRFIPSFLKARELIESGSIGELKLIESDFCFQPPYDAKGRLFNPELGGGALLDVGLYPVFLALEFGGSISDLKAMASFDKTGIDSQCNMLIEHENGIQSVLCCSVITNGRVESLIHGTRGMLRLNKWWHTPTSIDLILNGEEAVHFSFDEPGFGYQYEAAEVMACLDAGRIQSEIFSWEHSRRLIRELDRIRETTGIRYPEKIEKI